MAAGLAAKRDAYEKMRESYEYMKNQYNMACDDASELLAERNKLAAREAAITWALRRAVDQLEGKALAEVLEILRVNGLGYDDDGHLINKE